MHALCTKKVFLKQEDKSFLCDVLCDAQNNYDYFFFVLKFSFLYSKDISCSNCSNYSKAKQSQDLHRYKPNSYRLSNFFSLSVLRQSDYYKVVIKNPVYGDMDKSHNGRDFTYSLSLKYSLPYPMIFRTSPKYQKYHIKSWVMHDLDNDQRKNLHYHIRNYDYFGTTATVLQLLYEKFPSQHDELSREVVAELQYLQEHYTIVPKNHHLFSEYKKSYEK